MIDAIAGRRHRNAAGNSVLSDVASLHAVRATPCGRKQPSLSGSIRLVRLDETAVAGNLPATDAPVDAVAEIADVAIDLAETLRRKVTGRQHPLGEAARAWLEGKALPGQLHDHPSLVLWIARPSNQTRSFETFQQRREGAGFQREPLGNPAHRLAILMPEHVHHQILRIGQAKRFQNRLVGALIAIPAE